MTPWCFKTGWSAEQKMNDKDAELHDLKRLLGSLEARVSRIEQKLSPQSESGADLLNESVSVCDRDREEEKPGSPAPVMLEDMDEFARPASSLETRIGLYWLSRLGIGFLVVGIALLIMYSFQYFGAAAKIATGYIAALSLIVLSELLERRRVVLWYSRILSGGGWALAYFTTFAIHHVESVRLIKDPVVDLLLMLLVAGLSVAHAVTKHSQLMSMFAVALGYLTFALNNASQDAASASAVLVLVTVLLVCREKWYRLLTTAVCFAYTTQIWIYNQAHFYQDAAFLIPYLLCFGLVPLTLSEDNKANMRRLVIVATVNALGFILLFLPAADQAFGKPASVIHLVLAGFFAGLSRLYKMKNLTAVATVNSLAALLLLTTYIAVCGINNWFWLAYAFELSVLVWSGSRYKIRAFRWFALALGFLLTAGTLAQYLASDSVDLLGYRFPFCLCMASGAVFSFAYCAYINRRQAGAIGQIEKNVAFYAFGHMAAIVAFWLPVALACGHFDQIEKMASDQAGPFILLFWSAQALATACLGVRARSAYIRIAAVLHSSVCGFFSLFICREQGFVSSVAVALMYLQAYIFCPLIWRQKFTDLKLLFRMQVVLASLCAWFLALINAGAWVSCVWSAEGLLLLVFGFGLGDKWFRVSGLFVFAALVFRLLFVDLAGAETVYRIFAFIVAGLILLLSACGYAWFSKKLDRPELAGKP